MAGSSHGHGHTPAAWTGSIIVFIGFCVSGAYMVMDNPVGFWLGMVLLPVGGVVGWIMRGMGLGQPKSNSQPLRMMQSVTTAKAVSPKATREPVAAEG
ncbi:HGxxPAAW family protein [Streptomyces cadmiisoli]|uniref:HGxxPAAW family protein n=1 Tax=Streptomyces cadmiisoli TaxID=2184053 RepID=UPI00365BCD5A